MPRLDRPYLLAVAAGFAVATALGLLVLSTRFGITTPSMIDDWYYASQASKSLGGLLHPFVAPIGARFRPSFELWSQLEWHSLGAPSDLTGPNLWGALRILLFVGGAVAVPGVIAATSRPRPSPLAIAALCAGTGVILFSGPWTDVDFFRLGPQEPVMFGAAACGGALLLWAAGRLIASPGERRSTGKTALLAAAFGCGIGLWVLGIYYKESSISVLVLAPFLYLFLDRRWRERGMIKQPLWRERPFQVTAIVMLLPIVHVLVVSSTISDKGASLYGADRPSGVLGWAERAIDSLSFQWSHWNELVGTGAWRAIAVAVLVLLAVALALRWRPFPWLAIGFVATGWAILIVQGLPLHEESRYYIASMALFAGAALLLLAQAPAPVLWVGVAAVFVLGIANFGDVRDRLDQWSTKEKDEASAVRLIADLHPASCRVYMDNLDIERSEAMPRMLRLIGADLRGPCRPGSGTMIVGLRGPLPAEALGTTKPMRHVCAQSSVVATTDIWEITDCRRLRSRVRGEPVKDILRPNRVVPGLGPFAVRRLCAERYGRTRCGLKS